MLRQLWNLYGNSNKLRYILLDSHHNLWLSTWTEQLHRYNMDTKVLTTYSLKAILKQETGIDTTSNTILVNAMYEDRQENLWIATDYAGLLRFDREGDRFNAITSDEKLKNGLRYSFSILTIFQDRDDNIWLGTDRGISIFNPYRHYFQSIHHVDGNKASLPKYDINDVIETNQGEILVATWGGGISIYDQQWNFIRNVHFAGPPALDLVWSFVSLDDGTIWAGTQNGYIHQYDPVRHSFKTIHPKETNNSTIATMARDPDGNILIGLYSGKIALWDKAGEKFYAYNDSLTSPNIPFTGVIDILPDHAGKAWMTTSNGLLLFDIKKRAYTHLFQPDSLNTRAEITLQGMAVHNDSMLLIGSVYKGLYFFNTNSGRFSRTPADDVFQSTSVYAIRKDLTGHIWLTTNFTIVKMTPDFSQFTRFNIDQSIINASFGSSRFYQLHDGRWVTYTPAEIVCFDPGAIGKDAGNHPQVKICGFSVFDKKIQVDSFITSHVPIILTYNNNFVSIEFSALTYTDIRQINYYYRMTGVDQKWIHTTTKQFADYTDLHPGQYLFEVKADYGNGPTSITSLAIEVTPPWWGTWWFRILCLLALGSLIYLIVRNRIDSIRKEAALKHRIAETEMMALRSQMNPHFIFNCINSIDAMIQRNDKYKATVYLNKFARLIRNVLDSSKQNKIQLSRDMETLQLYIDLELFRHQDKFTATVTADEELLQNDYKVPPLIIQPYVENAILHGLRHKMDHPGILSVSVTKREECIMYVIEDNGVGRKAVNGDSKKDSNGYGMQISSDRVRLFNNEEIASVHITDLEINGMPAGTRVEVQLKIQ
ncbi:MAG: histidine kinase [Saprospiraceae bacterium]|nr:histidine kinase [Candidatus Opimibacter iunctus]